MSVEHAQKRKKQGVFFDSLYLMVTDGCDSRCVLCDYWLIKKPRYIDAGYVETKVAPFIARSGVEVVCITGGEPTLHPELPRVVSALRGAGATATLTTSTTNLSRHFEALQDQVNNYLVSLDGADRQTYLASRGIDHFDQTVSWVTRIRKSTEAEIAVSCVLQACNLESVKAIYELSVNAGAHRLFFRAPDLKQGSFGRSTPIRPKTIKQTRVTLKQVESLREQLAEVQQLDKKHGMLGQSRADLQRKVRYFECAARDTRYSEPDRLCDVPLTSLVVQPDGTCKPCFYLPHSQPFDERPAAGPAFDEVYARMLDDKSFRKEWCNACQQFDGHKVKPAS